MKRFALLTCAAVLAVPAAARATTVADLHHWTPYVLAMPVRDVDPAFTDLQAKAGKTLPHFTSSIVSPLDGKTYRFSIVGTNPQTSKRRTTIPVLPIALRLHFPGGVVLDPTKPGCNDSVAVVDRFYKGPNFNPVPIVSNGVAVGTVQVTDAFQRAEFWQYARGSNYHVELKLAAPVRIIDVTAPAGSQAVTGACAGSAHDVGEIDANAYDAIVQKIDRQYAKPSQLPLVLTYNTVFTSGICCIIGYHQTYAAPGGGTQIYSVGTYNDPGVFNAPIEDIHVWTHEIGEALNDPFGSNGTPAWGHIGQVSKCQNNLEVGDPLTGTPYTLTYNGFTYHPQELAFFSWFYRTPSVGTGGTYSFEGTFTSTQAVCQ